MLELIATLACGYVWLVYSEAFAVVLYRHAPTAYALPLYENGRAVFAVVLIAVLVLLSLAVRMLRAGRGSDGLRNSAAGRRAIGAVASAGLFAALAVGGNIIVGVIVGPHLALEVIVAIGVWPLLRPAKIFLGRSTRPLRLLIGTRYVGMGGTATFSGLLDDWANPWRSGQILLGASHYDPRWLVGFDDDRHLTTIATSRAGKGRAAIIPNLITWPGSAVIIDPKAQNASVTALKRGDGDQGMVDCLGQTVRILDPLGEVRDARLQKYIARFNPLAELDPTAPDYSERVDLIADALVVPGSSKESYFDNSARALICGLIDYVRMSKSVGNDERTLSTVRGLLTHPDGPPLEEMAEMGGQAQTGAAGPLSAGENAKGDVISTAIAHTQWLDSAGMQRTLSASDFSLRDLNNGATTIYLVIPPQYLHIHGRFLRLFVNLALQAAAEGRKRRHATLFVLDEFYVLGRLDQLAKSAGVMAGYGVKLWTIIQNIGQLKELYPQNWETFMGNAGLWMVFALNDQTTAKYLSDRLGRRILWRKMRGAAGFDWEVTGGASLRDPLELSRTISRASNSITVFTETGEAFLLRRAPYDKLFPKTHYTQDPFETGERE